MFSPALTDGALGDMFYLFSANNPGLVLDIIEGTKKKKEKILELDFSPVILKLLLDHTEFVFDFRCNETKQLGVGCQLHRGHPPGRGCGQASCMQCKFMGKDPTCSILSQDPVCFGI